MWAWIAFLGGSSALLLWMSYAQPFPEISGRWAWIMLGLTGLLAMAMSSPRETNPDLPLIISGIVGGFGVMIGAWFDRRNRDVILAPFAGMWFVAAAITALADGWSSYGTTEQWVGFILATTVIGLEVFLFWKGLIIGIPGVSWSQAALRQLDRGLIDGDRGAISMFEKSWSVDDSWLDAMSHAALVRIHDFRGDSATSAKHSEMLERLGGVDIVDVSWLAKIDSCLKRLNQPITESE